MTRRYDKEFKLYAVKLVVEDGKRVAEAARELDLAHQTLSRWIAKYKKDQENSFVGSGNRNQVDQEKEDKDKQVRDLQEEVAILKKAMGIFAKNQKRFMVLSRNTDMSSVSRRCARC